MTIGQRLFLALWILAAGWLAVWLFVAWSTKSASDWAFFAGIGAVPVALLALIQFVALGHPGPLGLLRRR